MMPEDALYMVPSTLILPLKVLLTILKTKVKVPAAEVVNEILVADSIFRHWVSVSPSKVSVPFEVERFALAKL